MTQHERSIIFRRNFTDLQAMIDRGNIIRTLAARSGDGRRQRGASSRWARSNTRATGRSTKGDRTT
jgi:hypothetical protein